MHHLFSGGHNISPEKFIYIYLQVKICIIFVFLISLLVGVPQAQKHLTHSNMDGRLTDRISSIVFDLFEPLFQFSSRRIVLVIAKVIAIRVPSNVHSCLETEQAMISCKIICKNTPVWKQIKSLLYYASAQWVGETKLFLGMQALPIPLWCSFDTVDNSLAWFTFTKISLGFYIWKLVLSLYLFRNNPSYAIPCNDIIACWKVNRCPKC